MDDLNQLSKDELYELAQEKDVEGRSSMSKAQLVEALGDGASAGGREGRSETSSRPIWKGAVNFGLITIPVGLYTAVEDRDVSFHLLAGENGARVRYQRVNEATGEEVDWDDIVKGYEYEPGKYVTFTDEEIEALQPPSVRVVDIAGFVDSESVDPLYFERSYYVAPEETSAKAYSLLVAALE
jgi:DNA end-binding protein Ku